MKLLSIGSDAKTVKGEKRGYLTGICYLAPTATPRTVCPFATDECKAACLYSAGRGGFNSVQKSRIAKTGLWHNAKEATYENTIHYLNYNDCIDACSSCE